MQLKKMILLSKRIKKARIIEFHPRTTIITGENDTGKSSLIKSIYQTLGASVRETSNWSQTGTINFLQFSFIKESYVALYHRKPRWFFIKNITTGEAHFFEKVTADLAPFINRIFNFNLQLTDRDGTRKGPPPSFLFLPFYIDQDMGWQKNWNSFERLAQFPQWKNDLIDYFIGKKTPKYFTLKTSKVSLQSDLKNQESHLTTVTQVLGEVKLPKVDGLPDLSEQGFDREIHELEAKLSRLFAEKTGAKKALLEYGNRERIIEDQLKIIEQIDQDVDLDYQFASSELSENEVECPTCGAHYLNDITNRFRLARGVEKAKNILQDLLNELDEIRSLIILNRNHVIEVREQVKDIKELLQEKRQSISFGDFIELKTSERVNERIDSSILAHQNVVATTLEQIDIAEEQMEKEVDINRSKAINRKYKGLMSKNMEQLHVHNLQDSSFTSPERSILTSGSDLPRALLGYFFAILDLIRTNESVPFFPVVIDSPKQQDPDLPNTIAVFSFIRDYVAQGLQLVLSSVAIPKEVDFGDCYHLKLKDKSSMLTESMYEEASYIFQPFLDEAHQISTNNGGNDK